MSLLEDAVRQEVADTSPEEVLRRVLDALPPVDDVKVGETVVKLVQGVATRESQELPGLGNWTEVRWGDTGKTTSFKTRFLRRVRP